MAGTPVVTTTIGSEGLDLRHGEHVLIADTTAEFADAVTHLLTDRAHWEHLARAGYEHVAASHAPERVAERFHDMIDSVLSAPPRSVSASVARPGKSEGREPSYGETRFAVAATLQSITSLGSTVLVVSNGDDALLMCAGRRVQHFPQGENGQWSGFHPGDGASAIAQLEELREEGARYFVVPSFQFWWLHQYSDLTAHLAANYRRIYFDDHLIVFDLAPEPRPAFVGRPPTDRRERVLVLGSYEGARSAPPARLLEELDRSQAFDVRQRWRPTGVRRLDAEGVDADWFLHVDATAVLPAGFVDDFLGIVSALSALGVERAQPAHMCGPAGGPPGTERQLGVLGREVEGRTPIPVLAVRAGAALEGPTALVDAVPIALEPADPPGSGSPHLQQGARRLQRRRWWPAPRRPAQRWSAAADQRPARHVRAAGAARGLSGGLLPPGAPGLGARGGGRRRWLRGYRHAARARRLRPAPSAHLDAHRALWSRCGEEPCAAPRAGRRSSCSSTTTTVRHRTS